MSPSLEEVLAELSRRVSLTPREGEEEGGNQEFLRDDFVGLGLQKAWKGTSDYRLHGPTSQAVYYVRNHFTKQHGPALEFFDGPEPWGDSIGMVRCGLDGKLWNISYQGPSKIPAPEEPTEEKPEGEKKTGLVEKPTLEKKTTEQQRKEALKIMVFAEDNTGNTRSMVIPAENPELGDRPQRYIWKLGDLYPSTTSRSEEKKNTNEDTETARYLFSDYQRKRTDRDMYLVHARTGEVVAIFSAEATEKQWTVGGFYMKRGMSLTLHMAALISGVGFVDYLDSCRYRRFRDLGNLNYFNSPLYS